MINNFLKIPKNIFQTTPPSPLGFQLALFLPNSGFILDKDKWWEEKYVKVNKQLLTLIIRYVTMLCRNYEDIKIEHAMPAQDRTLYYASFSEILHK